MLSTLETHGFLGERSEKWLFTLSTRVKHVGLFLGSCHLMLNPKNVQSWFVLTLIDPGGEGCADLGLGVWVACGISEPAVEAFVYGTVELQPLLSAQLCSEKAGGAWSIVKGAEANRECVVVYRNVAEGRKQLFSFE